MKGLQQKLTHGASTVIHNFSPSTQQEGRSEAEASLIHRASSKIARAI